MSMTITAMMGWLAVALAGPMQPGLRVTRTIVADMIVMRVPVRPMPMARHVEWREGKGPKCIALKDVRGAAMAAPGSVDFLLDGRKRVRARFDKNCPALDFYSDFYVEAADERMCARREEVRSRMGSRCTIDKFRSLSLVERP